MGILSVVLIEGVFGFVSIVIGKYLVWNNLKLGWKLNIIFNILCWFEKGFYCYIRM